MWDTVAQRFPTFFKHYFLVIIKWHIDAAIYKIYSQNFF